MMSFEDLPPLLKSHTAMHEVHLNTAGVCPRAASSAPGNAAHHNNYMSNQDTSRAPEHSRHILYTHAHLLYQEEEHMRI
jgi:hypothetical protein